VTPHNKWEWKNEFVTINHALKCMSWAYIDEDNVEICDRFKNDNKRYLNFRILSTLWGWTFDFLPLKVEFLNFVV
jgi:hypothetical protein